MEVVAFSSLKENILKINNKKGQSTIEFLMCFMYSFGVIFVFFGIAYNIGNGFMTHYATYMASRSYLVADANSADSDSGDSFAATQAQKVFQKFKIDKLIPGTKNNIQINTNSDNNNNVFTGVYFEFVGKFSTVPFMGSKHKINFLSESFLGREPIRAECLKRVCKAFQMINGSCKKFSTFFDNGC